MTNVPPDVTFFNEPLICGPSPGQCAAMAGWPVLLFGIILLVVNACRQVVMFRRPEGLGVSERPSTIGIAGAWFSFMVGIGMTWYGLHCTWLAGAMSGGVDQGLLLLSYSHSSIPGFIGLLILAGGFFEAALFKTLWMRKMKTEHNQASQPIAGKPGSG
jgi:hypothetical protein